MEKETLELALIFSCLNEQELKVLNAKMDGLSYRQIGELLGTKQERPRQILFKAWWKLRRRIRSINHGLPISDAIEPYRNSKWYAKTAQPNPTPAD